MSRFQPPAAPYEALEAVIRRELELVATRDFERLPALKRERAEIVKLIAPVAPPPEARASLARGRALQLQPAAALARVRSAIVRDLARVRQAQRAAAGYAPARAPHRRIVTSA